MPRNRGGLRGRLDRIEGDAHQTMATARSSVLSIEDVVRGLIEDLQDGVTFELEIAGKTMPIKLRVLPAETA
jgi:hypothetical protein